MKNCRGVAKKKNDGARRTPWDLSGLGTKKGNKIGKSKKKALDLHYGSAT